MKFLAAALTLTLTSAAFLAAQAPQAPSDDGAAHSVAMDHGKKALIPPSKSLNVTVQGHTSTFSVDELLKLPQTTVHVHNPHRNADEDYTGPLLSDVLARAGLTASKETESLILHSAVIATGTDHYFVLLSATEAEPMFSKSQTIVAVTKSGLPDTDGGIIQLITANDARPARWVHGLANLNLVSMQAQP